MDVAKYYNKKANNYDAERSSGFLKKIVFKEKREILAFLDVKKGDGILDVGCGEGFYSKIIKSMGGKVFGIDISEKMLKKYKENGFEGELLNIEKSPTHKKFDKILCAGTLEFTANPFLALKNIKESLKKNGIFVLLYPRLTPGGFAYKIYHIRHGIRINLFSDKKIHRYLQSNKMKIINLRKPTFFTGVLKAQKTN